MNQLKKIVLLIFLMLPTAWLFAGDKEYSISLTQFPGENLYPRGAYFNVHSSLSDQVNDTVSQWGLDSLFDTSSLTDSFYSELIPEVFKAGNPIFVDVQYEEIRTNPFSDEIGGNSYLRSYFEVTMKVYSSRQDGVDFYENPQYVMDKMIYSDTREEERYFLEGKAPPVRRSTASYTSAKAAESSGNLPGGIHCQYRNSFRNRAEFR